MTPETSNNFTGGFTVDILGVNFTLDFFDIRLKNRLSVSQHFTLTDIAEGAAHRRWCDQRGESGGHSSSLSMTSDTTTQGIDFVVTAPIPNGSAIAVYNFTSNTTVTDHNPDTLDDHRIRELQENLPTHRGSLTARSIHNGYVERARDVPVISAVGSILKITYRIQTRQALENTLARVIFDLETTYTVGVGIGTHCSVEEIS